MKQEGPLTLTLRYSLGYGRVRSIPIVSALMRYTINQLAKLAQVSVRTLHYYDEIGLLKPERVSHNSYRQYGELEMLKLQQILFFRELEFSLEDIKAIL